jgi:hypothetical protein
MKLDVMQGVHGTKIEKILTLIFNVSRRGGKKTVGKTQKNFFSAKKIENFIKTV